MVDSVLSLISDDLYSPGQNGVVACALCNWACMSDGHVPDEVVSGPGMHSVSSQTETFSNVMDRMNKLKELQDSLGEMAFIPENISGDTKMKAPTGFTKESIFCIYSLWNVEEDLQTGNFLADEQMEEVRAVLENDCSTTTSLIEDFPKTTASQDILKERSPLPSSSNKDKKGKNQFK
ncbi:hypothetical protein AVEN_263622-1 [Araneus ventricosus]|uniref:Uncharacterized protein n=1 Tax=Araneus ventricosus TaxID=182803 RepID=A0A4Y2ATK6_ARAVE|nr:hypothetical protein AVEN_263622-1 [Araneus ventricosus]